MVSKKLIIILIAAMVVTIGVVVYDLMTDDQCGTQEGCD